MADDEQPFDQGPDENFEDGPKEDAEPDLDGPESPDRSFSSEIENRMPRDLEEKEVKVMGVYEHLEQGMEPAAFVLLRDTRGRQVLIWIGRYEAYAISLALEGSAPDRPMTHDLMKNMMDRLGGRMERIVIDDLWHETYYAKISIATNAHMVDVDSRPSDAIALALRAKAPIFVAETVLEQAAVGEDFDTPQE